MNKKIIVLLIILGMIVSSLGCSGSNNVEAGNELDETVEKDQSVSTQDTVEEVTDYSDVAFLTALGNGLMMRWDYNDRESNSTFGSEQYKKELQESIEFELGYIEKYKDETFEDQELQALAISYIDSVEKQLSILDDYPDKNDFVNSWDDAYSERAAILKQLFENYTVPMNEGYEDIIAEFTDPESNVTEKAQQEPGLLVVGSKSVQSDSYTDLKVILKNNTDMILCTPTVYVSLLDGAGDIIDGIEPQAMVTVFPGQSIALSTYTETKDAEAFVVNSEGWVQFADESYKVLIGGQLDPISLDTEENEFEECGKASINCIDQDVDNSVNGHDLGISIEDMYIEEQEGSYAKCYAKIKNNTSSVIDTPTLHASFMDDNGNIIGWDMMQEMAKVNPDQAITLSCLVEEDDLAYFTVSWGSYLVEGEYVSGYLATIPKAAEK